MKNIVTQSFTYVKKHFRFVVACVLSVFATSLMAENAVFEGEDLNVSDGPKTVGYITLSVPETKGMSWQNNMLYTGGSGYTFNLSAKDVAISEVLITMNVTSNRYKSDNITNCTSCTKEGNVYTCIFDEPQTSIDFKNNGGGVGITKLEVTYVVGGGSGGETPEPEEPVAVTGVSLNKEEASIAVGGSTSLSFTIEPADATNKNVTWSSSDEAVATISDKGVVTGVAEGEAIITVTTEDGEFTATCTVTVSAGTEPEPAEPIVNDRVDVSGNTVWDWTKASAQEEVKLTAETTPAKNDTFLLSILEDINNNADFNAQALEVSGEYMVRDGKFFQGQMIRFNTTVDGFVSVEYSNTGNRENEEERRYLIINGAKYGEGTMSSRENVTTGNIAVSAGEVQISSLMADHSDPEKAIAPQYLRIYKITFSTSAEIEPEPEEPVAVTSISLNKETASVTAGGSTSLSFTIEPADATNQNVTWSSSDEAVATVSDNGVVTGVAEGEATITVTTEEGEFTATCIVTVSAGTEPDPEEPITGNGWTWQFSGAEAPETGTSEPDNGITVEFLSSDPEKTFSVESAAYNAAVPDELKSKGTKGLKMGGNALYLKVTLKAGKFLVGDQVTICGYNPWKVSSSEDHSGDIAASVATGTGKGDYNIGSFSLAADAEALYMMRAEGTGTGIAAIKVVRGGETPEPEEPVAVTGVSLNKEEASVAVGGSTSLSFTIEPADATNKNVTWSSSDEAVATVSDNGVVTGVAEGEAIITVTTEDGEFTATCTVTVSAGTEPDPEEPVAVTGISLNRSTLSIDEGASAVLTATVKPADATNQNVTWSSSNSSVASVANGKVTGVAEGTATITATTEEGGFEATCKVTVMAGTPIPDTKLSLHEPEVYEAKEIAGGYGGTLSVFDGHEYEVYYVTRDAESNLTVATTPIEKVAGVCTESTDENVAVAIDGWFKLTSNGTSGSTNGTAKDEYQTSVRCAKLLNDQSLEMHIKGFDQFSFYGKDNNENTEKGKMFEVYIDNVKQSTTPKKEYTIRRFDISTKEHVIRIVGIGGSNNEMTGFSLRVAQEPRTKWLKGNDSTQVVYQRASIKPVYYYTKYNSQGETQLIWEGDKADGIDLVIAGSDAIGDTLILTGEANCPIGTYNYRVVSLYNGMETRSASGTFTVASKIKALTDTIAEAYVGEVMDDVKFQFFALNESCISIQWQDQEPGGISGRQSGDNEYAIGGTPTQEGTFPFVISVLGGNSIEGKIIVKEIDMSNNPVLYLYKSSEIYEQDGVYQYLKAKNYNLIPRKARTDTLRPFEQYAKYKWILISEDADADNVEVLGVTKGGAGLPVLNMKAFSYAPERLDWGEPDYGSQTKNGKYITVQREDHPIFKAMNKKYGDRIQVLDDVVKRGLMPINIDMEGTLCLATALTRDINDYYGDGEPQTFIHEIPAAMRGGEKYICLPISISSSKKLAITGKELIDQVINYLLSDEEPSILIPELQINSFKILDVNGVIDQTNNTIEVAIDLADFMDSDKELDLTNIVPEVTVADPLTHVVPLQGEAVDFSTSIFRPVEFVVTDYINRRVYNVKVRTYNSVGIEEVYESGDWVNIFDIFGRKVATTNEDIYQMELPQGVYVVVTEKGQTIKIMK